MVANIRRSGLRNCGARTVRSEMEAKDARIAAGDHRFRDALPKSAHVAQPNAQNDFAGFMFERAIPVRATNINRSNFQPMPLGILDDRRRTVEAHGLAIQESAGKRRQITNFQKCARVGQQRETGRMRLGKSIGRKRADEFYDLVLCLSRESRFESCPRAIRSQSACMRCSERLWLSARRSSSA